MHEVTERGIQCRAAEGRAASCILYFPLTVRHYTETGEIRNQAIRGQVSSSSSSSSSRPRPTRSYLPMQPACLYT